MRIFVVASLLLLASCSKPGLNDRQLDEVSDAASAEAHDAVAESARVNELESRIEALESRLDDAGVQ